MQKSELSPYIEELEIYDDGVWSVQLKDSLVLNEDYEPNLGVMQDIIKLLVSSFAYNHKEVISSRFAYGGLDKEGELALNDPGEWYLYGIQDEGMEYRAFEDQIKIRVDVMQSEVLIHSLEIS